MKWIFRMVLIVVVLLVVAVVAANIVLKNHLTSVLNAQVIPTVEQQLGVPVSVGGASVQALRGSVVVDQVNVGNPAGFDDPTLFAVDHVDLQVNWGPLLRQRIAQVDHLDIRDAELWIIRNAQSNVNLQVLSDRLQPDKPAEPPAEPRPEAPTEDKAPAEPPAAREPITLPKARIQSVAVDTRIRYRDLTADAAKPVDIVMQNQLTVKGLSTVVEEQSEWATVTLTGNLASDASLCVTDLQGKIAPFSDPLRMSFDLAGDIGKVNLEALQSYLRQAGIEPEELALNVQLVCRDGVFDRKQSVIRLHMDNVQFSGKIKDELPKEVNYFSRLSVPLHIGGTLAAPRTDGLLTATLAALMTNIKDNVGAVAAGLVGSKLADELKERGGLEGILGEDAARQITDSLKEAGLEKSPLLKGLFGGQTASEESPPAEPESTSPPEEPSQPAATPEDQLKDALKGLLGGSKESADESTETDAEKQLKEGVKGLFKKLL